MKSLLSSIFLFCVFSILGQFAFGQVTGSAFAFEYDEAGNRKKRSISMDACAAPSNQGLGLTLKVILQGPYSGGSTMNNGLSDASLIPLLEPYSSVYTRQSGEGGETTTPSVMTATANDAIVDWVFIELRSNTTTIVATRAALLQKDTEVVDTDGSNVVRFPDVPAGDYYVVVRHRNHLSVMSDSKLTFSNYP